MVCSVLRLHSMMFPPSGTGTKIRQCRYLSVYLDCLEQSGNFIIIIVIIIILNESAFSTRFGMHR